jgi:hypothetical protein
MASYILNYLFLCCYITEFDVTSSIYTYIRVYIWNKIFWEGEKVTVDGSIQFSLNEVSNKQILKGNRRLCVTLRNLRKHRPQKTQEQTHTYTRISLHVLQIDILHRNFTYTHKPTQSERCSLLIVKQKGPSRSLSSGMRYCVLWEQQIFRRNLLPSPSAWKGKLVALFRASVREGNSNVIQQ